MSDTARFAGTPSLAATEPRRVSSTSATYATSTFGVFWKRPASCVPRPPQPISPTKILLLALGAADIMPLENAAPAANPADVVFKKSRRLLFADMEVLLGMGVVFTLPLETRRVK